MQPIKALIRKDLKAITTNKQLFSAIIAVPMIIGVFLPVIMVVILHFAPHEMGDFQAMLRLLPFSIEGNGQEAILSLLMNYLMPLFFLIIPIMAASVMAASAFVSEKEKSTLETLLLSPMSLKEIFTAKVLSAFILSVLVSLASFALMAVAVEIVCLLLLNTFIGLHISWVLILCLVGPAVSLCAIVLIVRTSAKSQNAMEAQQRSALLILPVFMLLAGQFTGVLMLSAWVLLILGALLLALSFYLLKGAMKRFSYEQLLGI